MSITEKELGRADSDSQFMHDGKLVGESDSESYVVRDESGTSRFLHGEPVIETGADVSNFAIDARDDEDQALTFRSFFIGTIVAGLGSALNEVFLTVFFFIGRSPLTFPSLSRYTFSNPSLS